MYDYRTIWGWMPIHNSKRRSQGVRAVAAGNGPRSLGESEKRQVEQAACWDSTKDKYLYMIMLST